MQKFAVDPELGLDCIAHTRNKKKTLSGNEAVKVIISNFAYAVYSILKAYTRRNFLCELAA